MDDEVATGARMGVAMRGAQAWGTALGAASLDDSLAALPRIWFP